MLIVIAQREPRPTRYPAWTYNPRPRDFAPANYLTSRLAKLRKLALACHQGEDGRYTLPGTGFEMTIAPEMERRLWDS